MVTFLIESFMNLKDFFITDEVFIIEGGGVTITRRLHTTRVSNFLHEKGFNLTTNNVNIVLNPT